MRHLIIGTAGHVDHGKTALVKALTNIDCDTHKEEKERGITINLGFSHLDLPSGDSLGIVDVPGHKDFIRTMVAGAYGIDLALLVVAADSGIMPQTEEHLRILEMLGVENGVVALTKADLVDEETLELAELEITDYLHGSPLENAPVVAVSAISGQGLEELVTAIQGIIPGVRDKKTSSVFRMYIDRIFNVRGMGYVVTGSVLEGAVRMGQDLFLMPGGSKKVKVRGLERHGQPVQEVFQGDRAALNLAGLKQEDYTRGMMLASKQLDDTRLVDATLKVFDPTLVLPVWTNVLFISGTFETSARMHLLDKDELHPGDSGLVQMHLNKPAVLSAKDKFILRNSSNDRTIGGGTIIDINPLHHRKRTEKLVRELNDLAEATLHSENMASLVKLELNKVNGPMLLTEVAAMLKADQEAILDELKQKGNDNILFFETGGQTILLTPEADKGYARMVADELTACHEKYPILEEGLTTKELSGKFGFTKNEAGRLYLDILMDRMAREGTLARRQRSWAMAGHKVVIDKKTEEDLKWVEDIYRVFGMDIPNAKEIEEKVHERKMNKERFKMLLRYLTDAGKMEFFESTHVHGSIVAEVRRKLLEIVAAKEDGINEKEFRELIGATRKFAQVMLGLLIEKGLVVKPTFYILITEKGKQSLQLNG